MRGRPVTVVGGARPNFVKVAPVVRALKARGLPVRLVHTGQHYDPALSDAFFTDLGLPPPDAHLEVGSGTHGAQTAAVLARFEEDLLQVPPAAVVVVGDVNSTLAAALAAVKLEIPVAHVEAGLRSFDRSMPEEINRLLTDQIARWLFVTEPSGVENLRREGVAEERIHLVGNVMIDSLEFTRPLWEGQVPRWAPPGPYAVLTLHRPSNVDRPEVLRRVLEAVGLLGRELPVLFPVHPRTRERLERFGLLEWAQKLPGLRLLPPVGYLDFLRLFAGARVLLTDSGGVQEEALVLGVPCVTLRDSTERPITLAGGANRLVGNDPGRIRAGIQAALRLPPGTVRRPPLWDGRAAERIAAVLARDLEEEGRR